jgi:predicted Zn-dependent peptidase
MNRGPCLRALTVTLAAILLVAGTARADLPRQLKFEPLEFTTPEVQELEFENGLHGYLIEDHELPVVNMVIMYRTSFPPMSKTGLPGIAGWAIRNGGSAEYPKEVIDDELEFVGASIETSSDPYDGKISANFLTKDTETVLAILADLILNPAFDAEQIELRKKSTIEGIRRRADDPRRLGRREFRKLIYSGHPAGWESTVETVSGLTRQDVLDFHRKYVRPENAVIGISGDMTAEEAQNLLNDLLAGWQPGGEPPVYPEMEFRMKPSVNYIYKDLNQAYIWAGHLSMNSSNPDGPYADIMNYILGGGSFTSWITQRVRSDEGLAYSARSSFGTSPLGYGRFVASCQTRSDAAMRALGLMIEQIERMKTEGPSQAELEDARQSFINRQVFDYESSSQVVRRMVYYDLFGLPLDTLEQDFEAYQPATLDDVRRVAREYLHPDELTILVVGDEELFDRPLTDLGEVTEIETEEEGL